MGNGSVKPIKDVRLGDKVESTDPRDGITTDKVVTALHNNHDTDLADLTVVDDSGARAIIHTTQNHPFWDVTSHKWTEAGKLRPGDQLRSSTTNHIHVVAVLPLIKPRTMLNLTVADIHTYYVMAGDTQVLVHNTCPTGGLIINEGPAPEKVYTVLDRVDSKGSPLAGYKGGREFLNDSNQGASVLPRGNGVTYREWDINPKITGVDRGPERLVTGSDGSAWYTNDHYRSFFRIR
jgi:guanyl-specific ribonuclease Sa